MWIRIPNTALNPLRWTGFLPKERRAAKHHEAEAFSYREGPHREVRLGPRRRQGRRTTRRVGYNYIIFSPFMRTRGVSLMCNDFFRIQIGLSGHSGSGSGSGSSSGSGSKSNLCRYSFFKGENPFGIQILLKVPGPTGSGSDYARKRMQIIFRFPFLNLFKFSIL